MAKTKWKQAQGLVSCEFGVQNILGELQCTKIQVAKMKSFAEDSSTKSPIVVDVIWRHYNSPRKTEMDSQSLTHSSTAQVFWSFHILSLQDDFL